MNRIPQCQLPLSKIPTLSVQTLPVFTALSVLSATLFTFSFISAFISGVVTLFVDEPAREHRSIQLSHNL